MAEPIPVLWQQETSRDQEEKSRVGHPRGESLLESRYIEFLVFFLPHPTLHLLYHNKLCIFYCWQYKMNLHTHQNTQKIYIKWRIRIGYQNDAQRHRQSELRQTKKGFCGFAWR
eukprot:158484_1